MFALESVWCHSAVNCAPAGTVSTVGEMWVSGFEPPLQMMFVEVTSVMGCELFSISVASNCRNTYTVIVRRTNAHEVTLVLTVDIRLLRMWLWSRLRRKCVRPYLEDSVRRRGCRQHQRPELHCVSRNCYGQGSFTLKLNTGSGAGCPKKLMRSTKLQLTPRLS